MARVVFCDICGEICQEGFAVLTGWWGRDHDFSPGVGHLDADEKLEADICQKCMATKLDSIPSRTDLSREFLYEEYLRQHPGCSTLGALRKTVPWVQDVTCNLCNSSCLDKHLRIERSLSDAEGVSIRFELCEKCFNSSPSLYPILEG